MIKGLSHITMIVSDLDRTQGILQSVLDAELIYDSQDKGFSLSEERFFMVGDVWVATMRGDPLPNRSYNHIAFAVDDAEIEVRQARAEALGLDIRPPRPRVDGEGRSLYFYMPDNHLIELHSGTLAERLVRYAQG